MDQVAEETLKFNDGSGKGSRSLAETGRAAGDESFDAPLLVRCEFVSQQSGPMLAWQPVGFAAVATVFLAVSVVETAFFHVCSPLVRTMVM